MESFSIVEETWQTAFNHSTIKVYHIALGKLHQEDFECVSAYLDTLNRICTFWMYLKILIKKKVKRSYFVTEKQLKGLNFIIS